MPIIQSKSKKSFGKNVEKEMDSGKPQPQALAIAYSVQRKNRKKLAFGGKAESTQEPQVADLSSDDSEDSRPASIADAILSKRKQYAEGGAVELEDHEEPNEFDEFNHDAVLKELYDDEQISPQPESSNEHGHDLPDEDSHDMVSSIRKRMKSSR